MQPHKVASQPEDDIAQRRQVLRQDFLRRIGWDKVEMEEMQADASFRRYYRLINAPSPALMMQDPPDRPPVPPYVMVEPFVAIAEHLLALGIRAPKILFKDIENGLLILEDFGDETYASLLDAGVPPQPYYEPAIDALVHLHRHPDRNALPLKPYSEQALVDEAMLMLDWYYPALTGQAPTEDMRQSFADVWRGLFKNLPADQQTLVLRDYHAPNLMRLHDAQGIQSCGVLDFQDALSGQFSYDVMSLIEDARRKIPEDVRAHLYARYLDGMGPEFDRAGFAYSFRVLAAQRHAKVLGIFVRLLKRDGKPRYLRFLPHVHGLFMRTLEDPIVAPLKQWFARHNIDLSALPVFPDHPLS